MTNVESLVLEQLRTIRADIGTIKHDTREATHRIGRIEISIAGLRRDMAHHDEVVAEQSVRIDRITERVERIEKRLEIEG